MSIRSHTRRMRSRALLGVLAVGLIFYFGWHAFNGNYGILARDRLRAQVAQLEAEAQGVHQERVALDRRVSLLRPESLDPDMLEERAREALSLVHPHDVVVVQRRRVL